MSAILYIIMSALGAEVRYIFSSAFDTAKFPYGILLANFLACLLVGFAVSLVDFDNNSQMALVGFAATLSTFSSLNYGLLQMLRSRRWGAFAAYFTLSGACTAAMIFIAAM